jgi:transcriptional regulator with XRE-family HTH domain
MIKKLRNECHLTQEELATKLGLTRSTIGMYETGKREPDFETLEKIADFFNVNMNYLLGKESNDVFLRIKKAMQHKNMDIQTFCDKIYSHPDQFYNWENNVSDSYLQFLPRISEALNIPEEYFWGNMSIGELSSNIDDDSKKLTTSNKDTDEIEKQQFNALINEFPVDSIKFLSRLCKNERINKDLTEKYVSKNTDIELSNYLKFENEFVNIGINNILNILHFLGFKTNYIIGYLTGILISLQPKDSDFDSMFDRLLFDETVKKLMLMANKLSKEDLDYVINSKELKTLKNKEVEEMLNKSKNALYESLSFETNDILNAAHSDNPTEDEIKKVEDIMDNDENWD